VINKVQDSIKSPFFWLTALFILTAKGHIEIIDTEYSIRTAKAIIEEGTMLIDPVLPGVDHIPSVEGTNKIYSQYGIGLLAIFIPIISLAKLLSFCFGFEEVMLSHFILSFYNIPFALLGLWHFREILKKLGKDHHTANFLMLCLATGTIFWKYVVTDFSEVTQISLLLGAIHSYINKECPKRWFFVSAYLSLLILLKLVYVVVLPPFVVLALIEGSKQKKIIKNLVQGASFLTFASLFLMVLNWFRFGNILESGYGTAQSAFSFNYLQRDFLDYLISFDRGLFPYSPILLVTLFGLREFFKRDKKIFFLIVTISASLLLLTASWVGWKGGYCWGNRNIVPIVPLIALGWGYLKLNNCWLHKNIFTFLLVLSLCVQIIGVSLKTHEWSVIAREFKDHPDPYYVPSEIKGSVFLFREKIFNDSGIYSAEKFVPEHDHKIDLTEYDSFYGFNFWIVHGAKLTDFMNIKFLGNLTVLIILTLSCLMLYRYRPIFIRRNLK
jgi:hypothetical protein